MDQQVADNAFLNTAHHLIQSKWDAVDFPLGQTQAIIVAQKWTGPNSGATSLELLAALTILISWEVLIACYGRVLHHNPMTIYHMILARY